MSISPDRMRVILDRWSTQSPLKITHRTTADLPQTAQDALFTVQNGAILMYGIIGRVTTIIGGVADAVRIISNPTVGADVPLCTNGTSIATDAVGTIYTLTGTVGNALAAATSGVYNLQPDPTIIPEGTIDFECAANNTGQVEWFLIWSPIEADSNIKVA